MKMFMVDLETLGVNPGCVILSIGSVRFDSGKPGDWFYRRVDLRNALDKGFHVESDTLMWWFRHGEAAIEHSGLGGCYVYEALTDFKEFIGTGKMEIWGHGSPFDNDILRSAYSRCHLHGDCWDRRSDRCYRTLCGTAGAGIPVDYEASLPLLDPPEWWGTAPRHHALRDAACQAAHALKIFGTLGLQV